MTPCPRCGGALQPIIVVTSPGERCEGLSCIHCGECLDPVIIENRTPERRRYWQGQSDQERRTLSRAEKILQENTEEAIRFSF